MSAIDPRLAAALAGRYRLERELGAGGMATVYLAEDVRHQRKVAVKVLRPEIGAALGRERFLREITTTANLRHPNILPLFDSGEGAGFLFYVMPLVEGESLRGRLKREGQLPLAEAMRIADEVADALAYAHERGVIHRDVKPENILLERGHAVVADFGIAHAIAVSGDAKLTMTGTVIGTPCYMSPEQARGDAVDGRTDLYALGCMVYEMLAGTPPFTGRTAMAILAGHALDPVPSLLHLRPGLDPSLTTAIERALAKAPSDRFATVHEWRTAMTAPPGGAEPSVDAGPTIAAPARPTGVFKPPPAPALPLLGRGDALDAAAARLRSGARVLTITGPGGTGKTRFAIELFGRVQQDYPGGAAFVSIASVTSAREVMPTVGVALDIAEAQGRSGVDAVATLFGDRRALLLLDNLEQVLEAAGDVAALVSRCPALQVVATSQAPLRIAAEIELPLPPLELPPEHASSVEVISQAPATALFAQRAARVKPGFAIVAANAATVAAICRRLDGLPLALELAAARVRILDPAALLARLDHALDLLTSGDRDLPERQRTLRATVDWSYSLLEAGEQRLLRRASVFAEGWTCDAMEAVCYAGSDRSRALDELGSLVEKNLVQVAGERYRLLETIREFAAERLDGAGETDRVRQAHADFYTGFARQVDAGIKGDGQLRAMARARRDNANALSALHWLTDQARAGDAAALEQALLMCGYLSWFWHMGGLHLTARVAVDALLAMAAPLGASRGRALAQMTGGMVSDSTGELERGLREWRGALADANAIDDDLARAEAGLGIGFTSLILGRMEEAAAALDDAIAHSRAAGQEFLYALNVALKGIQLGATGDVECGTALINEALAIQRRIEDYEGRGVALNGLAQLAFDRGDRTRALEHYREALESFEVVGDRPEIARVHGEIGWTLLADRRVPEAHRAFVASLRAHNEVGSPRGMGTALLGLAAAEAAEGRAERAVTLAAAADVMSERSGVVVVHAMAPALGHHIEAIKAALPKPTLDTLVARGRSLTPAGVLDMVAAQG